MSDSLKRSGFGHTIVGLVLFGIAFGYVEAAVVVYLRAMYDPIRRQLHPERPLGELFPLIQLSEIQHLDQGKETAVENRYELALASHMHRLKTELGRELATLVLLTGVGLLVAKNFNEFIAAFMIAFGIWDIFYYVFLKLLIDWPASLMTWDILFLIPTPWAGPVITPVLVAASMIVAGTLTLRRERRGQPVTLAPVHWIAIVAGGLTIVASFCWDYRNLAAGGYPAPFNWPLYFAGLLLGTAAFAHGFSRSEKAVPRPAQ